MKGMIKVGRWGNDHKHAAAAILDRQTFYLDVEDTYRGIKDIDLVPNLSAQNLQSIDIGKEFMLSHGYIKNDFDVGKWAAPGISLRNRSARTARGGMAQAVRRAAAVCSGAAGVGRKARLTSAAPANRGGSRPLPARNEKWRQHSKI